MSVGILKEHVLQRLTACCAFTQDRMHTYRKAIVHSKHLQQLQLLARSSRKDPREAIASSVEVCVWCAALAKRVWCGRVDMPPCISAPGQVSLTCRCSPVDRSRRLVSTEARCIWDIIDRLQARAPAEPLLLLLPSKLLSSGSPSEPGIHRYCKSQQGLDS